MNLRAIRAIYVNEMARTRRTLLQSIVAPVISTSLYFVVFGAAIGTRIAEIEGVSYGAFIVPGLVMLMLLTQIVSNASFGIFFPRFAGTMYEILSVPVSALEIVIGYVGAAATKSIILGVLILVTAGFFVPLRIETPSGCSPSWSAPPSPSACSASSSASGRKASSSSSSSRCSSSRRFTFLGGTFYSVSVLPPFWQTVTLFNPVVYLVSGFRWSFYGIADVAVAVSLLMTAIFFLVCLGAVWWIFRTGYRLKS